VAAAVAIHDGVLGVGAHDHRSHHVVVVTEVVIVNDFGTAEQFCDLVVDLMGVLGAFPHVIVEGVGDFGLRDANRVPVIPARHDTVLRFRQVFVEAVDGKLTGCLGPDVAIELRSDDPFFQQSAGDVIVRAMSSLCMEFDRCSFFAAYCRRKSPSRKLTTEVISCGPRPGHSGSLARKLTCVPG
jgi:hypothetical protein